MKTQMMRKGFSPDSQVSNFDTTRKTVKNLRLGISATVLCYLALVIGVAALPCAAESVLSSGAFVGGAATGSVNVITTSIGLDWNGLPQNNPNQIQVTSNAVASGAFYANLDFTQNPSTEYGVIWDMTNTSGQDWYSMHFTLQYAPLGDFSVTYDATGTFPSQPNGSPYSLPYNWTDTNIDFSGGAISGSGGTASFFLPLDVNGSCCSGNFIIWATPDYSPGTTPEPSSLLLFGSGILGVAGLLRKRFLG
jgi:hypothetical protein